MASQIAHIIYADKFFRKLELGKISGFEHPSEKINKDEFILGCTFPDIRLVDSTIKRKDTHMFFKHVDLNFSGLNSFQSGWKFHLYCDMRREELLNEYKFYSLDDTAELVGRPSKLFEDELVYGSYDNWEKITNYFNHVPSVEVGIEVDHETFTLWYAILANYTKEMPSDKSVRIMISKFPSLAQKTNEIVEKINKIRKNKKAVEILLKIKNEII